MMKEDSDDQRPGRLASTTCLCCPARLKAASKFLHNRLVAQENSIPFRQFLKPFPPLPLISKFLEAFGIRNRLNRLLAKWSQSAAA